MFKLSQTLIKSNEVIDKF